ncbi:branched-chain amino acid ABC transporter permease [Paracoccus yeei]|uniref:Branched-chain amino acid ABC transporter permease n=1 Tax=Paracoccus yeei TaxID=147645 RepID=A0A386UKJ9_9RHOB|nr:branched-chain amino acid ABC transporter permease [Paracoccus yeei]AYF00839.1 branched-chain amino acid ABC transporter permease [Paracoccus yeei]
MDLLPQLLFTGIGIGSIYALVALGFVLLIRSANVVNFAQGEFSMLGAYFMVILFTGLGLPYLPAMVAAVILMAVFGVLFASITYWPLRTRGQIPVIISTIGATILLSNLILATYGPSPQVLPGLFDGAGFVVGNVFMDSQYLTIIAFTIALVTVQYLIFEKTIIGKKLQATSQDREMASLLGIPVIAMIFGTFAYSAALGGLAGILVAPLLFVSVGIGPMIALKAFAANIIGGFGSIPGAIIGGLLIGVVETLGAAYVSVPYKDAFAFLMLLAVLLVSPQGIFGERIAEKA